MLLQRIELKGFLSHYGYKNQSGNIEPVGIDFRSSPLWLIHGPNGSGKSAIFDAITFALYKEHRGGGKNSHRLIHDAADKDRAEVNLEVELGDQRYLIQRTITRRRGSASVWGIVRRWIGDGWQAEPGTTNNVEDWVKKKLRMSYETFVSAVLLRQGEADAFLKAKPAQRKDRLMELLDLEFYRELGEAANRRRNQWREKRDELQQALDQLPQVTEADLENQRQEIDEIEQELEKARKAVKDKEAELKDARLAVDLLKEIAEKEEQQRYDDELIGRAEEILSNARRYRDLKGVLPLLDHLWATRRKLAEEEKKSEETQAAIANLEQGQTALASQLKQAQENEENARKAMEEAEMRLRQAQERQKELADQLKELKQIEDFEKQIQAAKAKLHPYRSLLDQADYIEGRYQRYEELREGVPRLQALKQANGQLDDAQKKLAKVQAAFTTAQEKAKTAQAEEQRCQKAMEIATQAYEAVFADLHPLQKELSILRDKLCRRDRVAHETECPVCGSRLDSEEARTRLEHEIAHWLKEVTRLEEEEARQQEALQRQVQVKRDAEIAHKHAREATGKAESELASVRSDLKHAKEAVSQAQKAVNLARQEAFTWANQFDQLTYFEAELISLKNAAKQWTELQKARRMESVVNGVISTCQMQLVNLPKWSPDERQQIRLDAEKMTQVVSKWQQKKDVAETEAGQARKNREGVEKRQQKVESDLKVAQNLFADRQNHKLETEREIERQQRALPLDWADHPACRDESELDPLKTECNQLSRVEEDEKQLHEAQKRVNQLAGAIQTLKNQLEALPTAHRRPIAFVEAEHDTLGKAATQSEDKRDEARPRLREMERQKQKYEGCRNARDQAEKEFDYYDRLARAFGRDGLQARIVQTAQEAIKIHANTTLGRLSNGVWQVELEENAQGTELEILARDLSQPGTPMRSFEYLSSGEAFRVAISLAVAIGQSISGGRTVDTLIIDEGFGRLDEVNRELLVSELHRLSEEVLQGGRIIVVSHQEDVCEGFGSRYRISKDPNGNVHIESHLAGDVPIR